MLSVVPCLGDALGVVGELKKLDSGTKVLIASAVPVKSHKSPIIFLWLLSFPASKLVDSFEISVTIFLQGSARSGSTYLLEADRATGST